MRDLPDGLADGGSAKPRAVWLERLVLVVVLAGAAFAVHANFEALGEDLGRLSPWVVSAAFVPAVGALFVSLQLWRVLMAELGSPLPWVSAARVFFLSQLGKYIPGSVWSVVAQMELSRRHQVPRRTSLAIGLVVFVIAGSAGLALGVALLPLAGEEVRERYWWLVAFLPLCFAALHPRLLGSALNGALRILRRDPLTDLPTWRGMGRAVALQVVVWILLGVQVWLLLVGLGAPPLESLPAAVGGYAVGYSLGMAAFFLPAGAGVRDAVLVVALSTVVPASTALLVALVSRLLATLADLLVAVPFARAPREAVRTDRE